MARITDLLAAGRTFSFEFFPPKDSEEQAVLTRTISELQPLKPSFVSVTYRGGRVSRERTTRVVIDLLRTTELTPMPHLTCVAHPRFELGEIIGGFRAAGLENLLALGGDPLPAEESYKELEYASQLVELGRWLGFESIGVAAHPAGHPRSPDLKSDREHLAFKMNEADFAITQFFFKLEEYERLRDEMAALGIRKPIIAGIMPITSLVSVQRMAQLSGYAVPDDIVRRIEAGGDDRAEIRKRGIEVATELCRELLDAGVPGLHFYTLNFSKATREIYDNLGLVKT
ncbi:MAG: 5,10-methylenetetrahydrofolate reductase [Chloroflexi bacterium]|nr:MAG: 5,10-methylenetetrahydrofolate reductase [Chloroflexota bacterium]TMF27374.1 MAG: 5,10-methylenetetrahydrofolate reductase [Chloroflexota bacterium]